MYEKHPRIPEPADKNIKLWRYLRADRFNDVLEKKGLYFSKCSQQQDKSEGQITNADWKKLELEIYPIFDNDSELSPKMKKIHKQNAMSIQSNDYPRDATFINCWHENKSECSRMWEEKVPDGEGVVIQTTFSKLCNSFKETPSRIWIGKVDYYDYNTSEILNDNLFSQFFSKDSQFVYENEFRAISWAHHPRSIGTSLETLIENIFVSPKATPLFYESIKSKMKNSGLAEINVLKSEFSA